MIWSKNILLFLCFAHCYYCLFLSKFNSCHHSRAVVARTFILHLIIIINTKITISIFEKKIKEGKLTLSFYIYNFEKGLLKYFTYVTLRK